MIELGEGLAPKARSCTVYVLFVEEELRYVGQTWGDLRKRLNKHRRPGPRDQTHRARLFRRCALLHIPTRIQSLQTGLTSQSQADECEIYWIDFFRKKGCRLVNETDGGRGGAASAAVVQNLRRARTGITEEQEREICSLYPRLNTRRLAEKFQVYHQSIIYILKSHGIARQDRFSSQGGLTLSEQSQALFDYLSGMSAPEVGERYHCSRTLIYGILDRAGLRARSDSEALSILDRSQALIAYVKYIHGDTIPTLAVSCRCSSAAVRNAFKRNNLPLKDKWAVRAPDGTVFASVKAAAAHYDVEENTISKGFSKPVRGGLFSRVPPQISESGVQPAK
jgi:hypothetical protein